MATLAIKGHATRGSEVIGLLEMLGGRIMYTYNGDDDTAVYFINGLYIMAYKYEDINCEKYKIFTLEQFLEKFPYKVGDKVLPKCYSHPVPRVITKMCFDGSEVCYYTNNKGDEFTANELQPYTEQKEESMKERIDKNTEKYNNEIFRCHFDSVTERVQVIPNKDYELQEMNGDYFFIKKQPQYPKTYEECCNVLGLEDYKSVTLINVTNKEEKLYTNLIRLTRCRDAYWKIAGDWKPDWKNLCQDKWVVYVSSSKLYLNEIPREFSNFILAFPTREMRDAFYENFKELIEECKELL